MGTTARRCVQTRPKAIKSALDVEVRTAHLADPDTVLTTMRAPGLRASTDPGEDMWASRPLVLDGWGFSAERIGSIKDMEADGEELWARTQLAKHHRYREYIAILGSASPEDEIGRVGSRVRPARNAIGEIRQVDRAGIIRCLELADQSIEFVFGQAHCAFEPTAPSNGPPCERASRHGRRSEERRVGKECRSRWSPYH